MNNQTEIEKLNEEIEKKHSEINKINKQIRSLETSGATAISTDGKTIRVGDKVYFYISHENKIEGLEIHSSTVEFVDNRFRQTEIYVKEREHGKYKWSTNTVFISGNPYSNRDIPTYYIFATFEALKKAGLDFCDRIIEKLESDLEVAKRKRNNIRRADESFGF